MWRIIRAELSYNRLLILGFAALVPLLFVSENLIEDLPQMFILVLVNLLAIYVFLFQSRDRRQVRHALLPLANRHKAAARSGLLIVITLFLYSLYLTVKAFVYWQQGGPAELNLRTSYLQVLFLLLFYHIFFLFRDIIVYPLQHNRYWSMTKDQMKTGLLILALLLNMLGVYVHITRPAWLMAFFDILFGHVYSVAEILALSLVTMVLVVLSIGSYCARRSYLEL